MVPEDISDAIARGDRQAVKAWLNAEDSDVNALSVYGQSPLGTCMLAAAQSQSKYEARNHLEVAHMLVARGARAGALGFERLLRSPLVMPITSLNVAGTDEMYAWYDLLIGAGADPNATSEVLVDGFRCRMSMLSRVLFFFPVTALITTEKRLELIKLLLRAGANPCACGTTYRPPPEFVPRIRLEALRSPLDEAEDFLQALSRDSAKSVYDATWALEDAVARAPELVDDEHYVAAKRLIKGVIAAGSYKKYLRLPLQELLNLLSLAQRGKLATTDPVMKALVSVDNHVVWNVFTYWVES